MALSVKEGGVWKTAAQVAVQDSGLWKVATKVWIKQGGLWKEAHSSGVSLVIASDVADYNIKDAAIAAGWDGVENINVTLTIEAGATVYSTVHELPTFGTYYLIADTTQTTPISLAGGASAPALRTGGFGGALQSLKIVNNGQIVGPGGMGGAGDTYFKSVVAGIAPTPGGTALLAEDPCVVTNNAGGLIGGGGDGGDGGGTPDGSGVGGRGGGGAGFGPSGFSDAYTIIYYDATAPYRASAAELNVPSAEGGATVAGTGEPGVGTGGDGADGNPLGDGAAIDGYANVTLTNGGTIAGGLTG